jgi:hypothetical protein
MTTDRDGNRSNPYHPDPKQCCEACVFRTGEHAAFCEAQPLTGEQALRALEAYRAMWKGWNPITSTETANA